MRVRVNRCTSGILNQRCLKPVRFMGAHSHVSDDDPAILTREKQRNLEGKTISTIPNAPGWNEELASDSELRVKADRCPVESVEELQHFTVEAVQKKHASVGVDESETEPDDVKS